MRAESPLRKACLAIALTVLSAPSSAAEVQEPTRPVTEVVVLATLHQYHTKVPRYGFAELAAIVEALKPDVIAMELTAEEIAARAPQRGKQEYPRAIYPLLER